jgi:hypothetical protein
MVVERMNMRRSGIWLICVAALAGAARWHASAQAPSAGASAPVAAHDLSGFWELSFDSRRVPAANLLPTITPAMLAQHRRNDAKAVRWCNLLGVPFVMDSGRPLDIRQGATTIVIAPENATSPRHLYLDRAAHISAEIFDPTTVGDSIARWEGDTLVVDTVGFHPDRGITSIPGGGFRTATSRLVERYTLLEDDNVLMVSFTWTDPKVFRAPHTYQYWYYRLPANYEPRTWLPCDPYDDLRTKFLEGPVTAPAANRTR